MEKKGIMYIAIIGMIAMFFVGWGVTSLIAPTGTAQRVTIIVTGSTTCEPVITAAAEDFMELNSNVDISVSGTGSGDGIADTIEGKNNIGMSSRNIKASENTSAGEDLTDFQFAKDGIAVIIDKDNTNAAWLEANGLTMDQVFEIYSGEITKWNEIDASLSSDNIVVHTRADGSGTRATFEELVTKDDEELGESSGYINSVTGFTEVASNTVMVETVKETPTGIGYCGLGYLDDTKVLAVPIDVGDGAVAPEVSSILDGSYAISRALHLTTNGQPKGWVRAFIDYIYGPVGQAIIEAEGFIRLWF